jgi:hypothetical protein
MREVINSGNDDGKGWLGGGQIGFNYEFLGHWVAGIEADIDVTDITSSTFACFTALAGIFATLMLKTLAQCGGDWATPSTMYSYMAQAVGRGDTAPTRRKSLA